MMVPAVNEGGFGTSEARCCRILRSPDDDTRPVQEGSQGTGPRRAWPALRAWYGDILISDASAKSARLASGDLEQRDLVLKGRNEPLRVRVLRVAAMRADT